MKQSVDMGEFASMEEWDLQAVVGGGMLNGSSTMIENNQSSCFSHLSNQQDVDDLDFLFPSSQHFESTADFLNELEEFYKPFYAISHPLSPQITPTSTSSVSVTDMKSPQKVRQHQNKQSTVGGATTSAVHAVKYKRRKNQHKKVVLQVTAQDLSSDMWAWRKYGQKPIKGSPYPRSYYRCSSLKGCLARKQVERSCSDPGMFIITYTAEHSHSQPTRRNSLAGTTRHKFPAAKSSTKTDHNAAKTGDYTSPNSTAVHSPTSPLMACTSEEDCPQQNSINEVEIQMKLGESDDNEFSIPSMTMGDDFFDGLDEFISDVSIAFCSSLNNN